MLRRLRSRVRLHVNASRRGLALPFRAPLQPRYAEARNYERRPGADGHPWRDESGQAGIMMMLGLLFLAVPLMLAVFDGGLLLNDRRDAQNLVDRAAMAGALGLHLDMLDTGADAENAAREWVVRNGGNFAADEIGIAATNTCYSANDPLKTAVTVTISRPAPTFLAGALGLGLRTGASATACIGVPVEYFGIFPLVVSAQGLVGTCFDANKKPIPGADCEIRIGDTTSSLVGALSVPYVSGGAQVDCSSSGSGANDFANNLTYGIQAWCSAGQEVWAKPGESKIKTFNGVKGRLALDGACDAAYRASGGTLSALQDAWRALDSYLLAYPGYHHGGLATSDNRGGIPGLGDGIDDFYEVWSYPGPGAPASGLTPLNCPGYAGEANSPRNIVLIVVNDVFDTSTTAAKKYVIMDFVRMYLEGCTRTSNSGQKEFRRDCGWSSLGSGVLTIHGRYVHQVKSPANKLGLTPLMLGDTDVFLKR